MALLDYMKKRHRGNYYHLTILSFFLVYIKEEIKKLYFFFVQKILYSMRTISILTLFIEFPILYIWISFRSNIRTQEKNRKNRKNREKGCRGLNVHSNAFSRWIITTTGSLSLSLYDDVKLLAASTAPPENVQTIEKQPNGGDPLAVPLQSVTFFSRNKRKILSFFFV
jgi:hypothetical protein